MPHIRQSRPDSGLDCQVQVLGPFQVVSSWLGSGTAIELVLLSLRQPISLYIGFQVPLPSEVRVRVKLTFIEETRQKSKIGAVPGRNNVSFVVRNTFSTKRCPLLLKLTGVPLLL